MKNCISFNDLSLFEEDYFSHKEYQLTQHTVMKNGIFSSCIDTNLQRELQPTFNVEVDHFKVCNQKQSGRCWLFAGLNVIRRILTQKLNVKEIELSQAYLQFYDKIEKANFAFEKAIKHANAPIESDENQFILTNILGDGGHFAMFVNLVKKYGVVPLSCMPDFAVNTATNELNSVLEAYVNQGIVELRQAVLDGSSKEVILRMKEGYLNDIYRILTISLGTPVKDFIFEFKDKDDHFVRLDKMTPQEFYDRYISVDLDDYISLSDAPNLHHELYQKYTNPLVNNVIGGDPVILFNVPIEDLKKYCIASLKNGEPIWFAGDVGKQSLRKDGYLADGILKTNDLFNIHYHLNKEERIAYHTSACTHAMTFTGVNLDANEKPNRWKVENSWGKDNGLDGYYVMSDAWFDEYVMWVFVRKSLLPQDLLDKYNASSIIPEGPNNTIFQKLD
jgi:hypothetical protein